jgi:hypothetical protein
VEARTLEKGATEGRGTTPGSGRVVTGAAEVAGSASAVGARAALALSFGAEVELEVEWGSEAPFNSLGVGVGVSVPRDEAVPA